MIRGRDDTRTRTTVDATRSLESGMTRGEIVAFFQRQQEAYEDLDAKTLAADSADGESGHAGIGAAAYAERSERTLFAPLFLFER